MQGTMTTAMHNRKSDASFLGFADSSERTKENQENAAFRTSTKNADDSASSLAVAYDGAADRDVHQEEIIFVATPHQPHRNGRHRIEKVQLYPLPGSLLLTRHQPDDKSPSPLGSSLSLATPVAPPPARSLLLDPSPWRDVNNNNNKQAPPFSSLRVATHHKNHSSSYGTAASPASSLSVSTASLTPTHSLTTIPTTPATLSVPPSMANASPYVVLLPGVHQTTSCSGHTTTAEEQQEAAPWQQDLPTYEHEEENNNDDDWSLSCSSTQPDEELSPTTGHHAVCPDSYYH